MKKRYDIAIIGGGTIGSMVFLDAVSRGFRCVLVEQDVIGMRTNAASLGLLQAGANYLANDRHLVSLNADDCGLLRRVASDFVQPQKFIVPVFHDSPYPLWFLDGFMSGYDSMTARNRPARHMLLSRNILCEEEPFLKSDVSGAVVFSEWIIDPIAFSRACVASAVEMGGRVYANYTAKNALWSPEYQGKIVRRIMAQSNVSRDHLRIGASLFVNAAGPWAPTVLNNVFCLPSFATRMTRGTSIIVEKKLANSAIVVFDATDKYITILPLNNGRTLIGPTNYDIDQETAADPDTARYEDSEIQELIAVVDRYFTVRIQKSDIVALRCGLRPQLPHRAIRPNDISHEYMLIDHEKRDGVANLITIFGGKLSSQVRMAKETVDAASEKLGCPKQWRLPTLRITRSGVTRRDETADGLQRIQKRYRKQYALAHTDDINQVARMRKLHAVILLAPFLLWGLCKALFRFFPIGNSDA